MIVLLIVAATMLYAVIGHFFFLKVHLHDGDPDGALAAFRGQDKPGAVWAVRTIWLVTLLLWPLLHAGGWIAVKVQDSMHGASDG